MGGCASSIGQLLVGDQQQDRDDRHVVVSADIRVPMVDQNLGETTTPTKIRRVDKDTATVGNEGSLFSSIPMSLIVEIMSFVEISDYRQLARLRLASKGFNEALPYLLRKSPICLGSSYGGTSASFFKKLVGFYGVGTYRTPYPRHGPSRYNGRSGRMPGPTELARNYMEENSAVSFYIPMSPSQRNFISSDYGHECIDFNFLFPACKMSMVTVVLYSPKIALEESSHDPHFPKPIALPWDLFLDEMTPKVKAEFPNIQHSPNGYKRGGKAPRKPLLIATKRRREPEPKPKPEPYFEEILLDRYDVLKQKYLDMHLADIERYYKEWEEYDKSKGIHKYMNRSNQQDDHLASLCHQIMSAESLDMFHKFVKEAVVKGMFLPVSSNSSSPPPPFSLYVDNDHGPTFVILTLTIPPEELTKPTIHRREGNIFYFRMVDLPTFEKLDDSDKIVQLLPLKENLSAEYAAYAIDKSQENESNEDDEITVWLPMCVDLYDDDGGLDDYHKHTCLRVPDLINKHQNKTTIEGVAIADGMVPSSLHDRLIQQIDRLAELQDPVDYHPHSNDVVRDLVHPALYAFVKGISPVAKDFRHDMKKNESGGSDCEESSNESEVSDDESRITKAYRDGNNINAYLHNYAINVIIYGNGDESESRNNDYWGRKYEASLEYQWLPTYFDVSLDGSCKICDYINNLVPRERYADLYKSLEELFSQALPLLESSYNFGKMVRLNMLKDGEDFNAYETSCYLYEGVEDNHCCSLKGKRLQVITKIVDYELDEGQQYEGVWHVEGMSHEEIVATCIYTLERDNELVGGDILFKRAFHKTEAGYCAENTSQDRCRSTTELIESGMVPLGRVETLFKRMVAFPNCHIHKVSTLECKAVPISTDEKNNNSAETISKGHSAGSIKQKRRIICFFLVNPLNQIVSTREIPPQQTSCGGSMTLEDAMHHRLELMKERKYVKQDWNVREIELCEH